MKTLSTLFKNNVREYGMLIALIAVMVFFQFRTDGVLMKPVNITNLVLQNSYIVIMALGMLLILAMGCVGSIYGTLNDTLVQTVVGSSLSMGLRNDQFTNANNFGEKYLDAKNQWAPRLGFAWDVNSDGSFKVFGNAGRYFLAMPNNVAIRGASASTCAAAGPTRHSACAARSTRLLATSSTPATSSRSRPRP